MQCPSTYECTAQIVVNEEEGDHQVHYVIGITSKSLADNSPLSPWEFQRCNGETVTITAQNIDAQLIEHIGCQYLDEICTQQLCGYSYQQPSIQAFEQRATVFDPLTGLESTLDSKTLTVIGTPDDTPEPFNFLDTVINFIMSIISKFIAFFQELIPVA